MVATNEFIQAIRGRKMIQLQFYSKEDGHILVRNCAPMDYGPSRRAHEKNDRFHLWDFESDQKNHVLSLSADQINSITVLGDTFNPDQFVTWDTNKSRWFVARDWGQYS